MVLGDLIIEETDVFFYYFDDKKKIFSVIPHLSNNTKYHRPVFIMQLKDGAYIEQDSSILTFLLFVVHYNTL